MAVNLAEQISKRSCQEGSHGFPAERFFEPTVESVQRVGSYVFASIRNPDDDDLESINLNLPPDWCKNWLCVMKAQEEYQAFPSTYTVGKEILATDGNTYTLMEADGRRTWVKK